MKTRKLVLWGTRDNVLEYRDRLASEAKELVALAEKESRGLTPEEELTHDEVLGEITKASAKLAEMERRDGLGDRLQEQFGGRAGRGGGSRTDESLGGLLVRHDAFQAFQRQQGGGFGTRMAPIELRAPLLSPAGGWDPLVQAPVPPGGIPAWGDVRAVSLFPTIPVPSGGNVSYLTHGTTTNAAAAVVEGAAKPETALAPALVSVPLATIAHWAQLSAQSLEDVEGLAAWVNSILLAGLLDEEEQQVLTGDGVSPNMRGLINTPGLTTAYAKAAGESVADAILKQAVLVQQASRLPVDGVILSTTAFGALATAKAGTAGPYLSLAPVSTTPAMSIWGLRTAVSAVLADGTAIVGSFRRGAAIYRKGTVRVDVSTDHSDFFIKNLVATRAELRELLAVYVPPAFGLCTALATP